MATAYIDTSCILALAFSERGASSVAKRIDDFDVLVSANLLEAELRAAFAREKVSTQPSEAPLFSRLGWVTPIRPLHDEIARTLAAGYVRGADCWHLASALYVSADATGLTFLTLDNRQREVAAALGFAT